MTSADKEHSHDGLLGWRILNPVRYNTVGEMGKQDRRGRGRGRVSCPSANSVQWFLSQYSQLKSVIGRHIHPIFASVDVALDCSLSNHSNVYTPDKIGN